MPAAPGRPSTTARLLGAVGWLATAAFLLGPLLAWLRVLPGLPGFVLYVAGGGWAAVASLLGVIAAARGFGLRPGVVMALFTTSLFTASVLISVAGPARRGAPRINDFTTDPADPPAFVAAATIPANAGRDMTYPTAFAADQAACCADLKPLDVPLPVAEATTVAAEVARGMPSWTVTRVDPASGAVEAVAESTLFGFRDDVVIRVRPADVAGSQVDVRSKSRDGKGDMGVNAARIRAFLDALRTRLGRSA